MACMKFCGKLSHRFAKTGFDTSTTTSYIQIYLAVWIANCVICVKLSACCTPL